MSTDGALKTMLMLVHAHVLIHRRELQPLLTDQNGSNQDRAKIFDSFVIVFN